MNDEVIVFEEPEVNENFEIEKYNSATVMDVLETLTTYKRVVSFVKQVLQVNIDYGTIPGTQKPTLYFPGAQKMRRFFSLYTETKLVTKTENWDTPITPSTFPLFSYTYETTVKDWHGRVLATCEGNCNSYETRYRWRWSQTVPLGANPGDYVAEGGVQTEYKFSIEKSETTGKYGKPQEYWDSWKEDIANNKVTLVQKKTGSGKMMDAYERDGVRYRIPSDNIFDQVNTLIKIAQKRSFVGAILLATGTSEFFTQDMEDLHLYATEEESIYTYVPSKNNASRRLMDYVRSKGQDNPGDFIKDTLVSHDAVFTLDIWDQVLNWIDDALNSEDKDAQE